MPTEYLVRDFMSSPVTTVPHDSNLLEAALALRRTGFRHLAIIHDEKVVGIITDRDIARFAPSMLTNISPEEYNAIFENTPLSKVMTKSPLTVTPSTPIQDAVKVLHNRKLGCLLVVEGEKLVGIITTSDMLSVLHRLITGEAPPQE